MEAGRICSVLILCIEFPVHTVKFVPRVHGAAQRILEITVSAHPATVVRYLLGDVVIFYVSGVMDFKYTGGCVLARCSDVLAPFGNRERVSACGKSCE